ncbi:hypothetical protein niasHS_003081 [Heterodera schachtii]|uniref:Phosphatidylinositol transfer protein N-terminal domain-containing protein n=1 Tax=Heterodera schachtii TaxID=97005 RepID=A0ABD2K9S9_HETSC
MLTKEYRIVMPLTTEEYQIAQMFLMDEQSRQLDEIVGDKEVRVEVVRDNEPFEGQNLCNGRFTSGHFSHKIYHFNSKTLPSLLRRLVPKGLMTVHEQTWNAFPYWKTDLTNPDFMKDSFLIRMETMLLSDPGTTKNAFGLTKDALNECKKMTVHVPFGVHRPWSVDGAVADQLRAVHVRLQIGDRQIQMARIPNRGGVFHAKAIPPPFLPVQSHNLFCSIDRWYALTLTPIRLIEDEAQQALDETDELATDDGSSQEMNASNGTER